MMLHKRGRHVVIDCAIFLNKHYLDHDRFSFLHRLSTMKRTRPETDKPPPNSPSKSAAGAGAGGVTTSSNNPPIESKHRYAVVCSSNINRSMEAHVAFFNHRLKVGSYGAGR